MSRHWTIKIIYIVIVFAVLILSGSQFFEHRHYELPIVAGPGVTRVAQLSDWCDELKGTMGDTKVFFMEGKEAGGKVLIIGNTHSNEPAAILASLIFIENAVVEKGTLIIIPQFNNSGSRNTKPGDGYPLFFEIPTAWG